MGERIEGPRGPTDGGPLRRLLREPLLHFVAAGAALFALHAWLRPGEVPDGGRPELRVTAADVEWIASAWTRQRGRPPTAEELRGLVAEFLREELLAREARELGLDRDDTVVRRRLAQKMMFLEEDATASEEPAEEDLRALHAADPAPFTEPATHTFSQVPFRSDRPEGDASGAAAAAAAALAAGDGGTPDPAGMGDPSMLPRRCERADRAEVAAQFGERFADALSDAPAGRWSGPVESAYGFHAVLVEERFPGRVRPFEEARPAVLDEWRRRRRDDRARARLEALFARVRVVADPEIAALLPEAARERPSSAPEDAR